MTERYDAVIIGAGVIGASVGPELARRGRRTLKIDALPAAGYGSISASAAIIRVYYSTRHGTALAYEAYHYWLHWAEHLGLPADADLAQYRETGRFGGFDSVSRTPPLVAGMSGVWEGANRHPVELK